jgi:membrane-associated phospholipid phosphatase
MMSAVRRFTVYKWRWGLTAAAIQSALYFGVGRLHLTRSTELLRAHLDDAIPFVPATAWLYLPIYAGIFIIAIVGFQTKRHFDSALRAFALILLIGLAGHLLIKAQYPRPVLRPPFANWSETFLAWVQSIDPPGNVFPSLHVAHTSSLALILYHENRRLGRWVIALALLLAGSTLTTKQHFIADVVAGFALAGFSRWIVLRGLAKEPVPIAAAEGPP